MINNDWQCCGNECHSKKIDQNCLGIQCFVMVEKHELRIRYM